jgi:hypothetical protein
MMPISAGAIISGSRMSAISARCFARMGLSASASARPRRSWQPVESRAKRSENPIARQKAASVMAAAKLARPMKDGDRKVRNVTSDRL